VEVAIIEKQHIEFHNLYSSHNITSRKIRWVGHVPHMQRQEMHIEF